MRIKTRDSTLEIDFKRNVTSLIRKFHAIQENYESATRDLNNAFKKHSLKSNPSTVEVLRKAHEETIISYAAEYKAHCIFLNNEPNKFLSETKRKLFCELSVSSNVAENNREKFKAKFEEVCEIASKIFLTECVDGELDKFNDYILSVPMLPYPELMYESQLSECADVLQEMTSNLFESAKF